MLTIKQLADKLGVSKPTITRNKPDDLEFEVIDGVNYINENMERQITEKVLQNKERYSGDTRNETDDTPLIQQLMQENAFLRAQIEEKDALIKEQTKLLDQQQQLNLITGKRLNELETKEQTETEEQHSNETVTKHTVSEGKKGFFSRIFGN
ncbi:hypothetical protein [Staphylococcus epidermidis]|uniref:hypothetical protein n=1 Tax=Staphylococcus epidermidis TaxID=1282 RepID=UPI000B7A70CF|nr:hypothetical protein [Staphylococcus epidermidis]